MKKWLLSLIAVPALLVGCSSNEPEVDTNEVPIDAAALEVVVDILTPEKVAVNETVELAAHITQNKENVNDADSVEFEVWESGYRDDGQMIDGEFDADGVYKADITFDHDGVYYMFAHTTARGLHVMPKQQIIVGEPDMSQVKEDDSDNSMDMNMEGHGDTHGNTSETEAEMNHTEHNSTEDSEHDHE
ncbi:FixH family protein [Ureibacillus aquaedulcis]|uniref:FixH family protein n=1 Tax=Ureibacillus aquaedulcis TaxID=3058421 RepID=A0ABT8GP09_9BACL|nr:FixH family protein [Ureibacillus sp. BA0131]MDN4493161.1 FixH family protein [Ureibacillus sp. BA0131]